METTKQQNNGANKVTKVSIKLAAAIWKTIAVNGSVTLNTLGGRDLSEANNNIMTIKLRSNWDHGHRFSEGASNGVIEVHYYGQVIKCWLHEMGFESFASELETLCIKVLGLDSGISHEASEIETDYFRANADYDDEESSFGTSQKVSFYANGILAYRVELGTQAHGPAANFQRIHSQVYVCNEDWQDSVFGDSVLTSPSADGDRRRLAKMVQVSA